MEYESKMEKIKRIGYKTTRSMVQNVGIKITATKGEEFYEGTVTEVFSEITSRCLPFVEGKDYKIGDMFFYEGNLVETCKIDSNGEGHSQGCDRCVFNEGLCNHDVETFREKILCVSRYRRDKLPVFFRLVSNNVIKR